jgi:hypothetical protein
LLPPALTFRVLRFFQARKKFAVNPVKLSGFKLKGFTISLQHLPDQEEDQENKNIFQYFDYAIIIAYL